MNEASGSVVSRRVHVGECLTCTLYVGEVNVVFDNIESEPKAQEYYFGTKITESKVVSKEATGVWSDLSNSRYRFCTSFVSYKQLESQLPFNRTILTDSQPPATSRVQIPFA